MSNETAMPRSRRAILAAAAGAAAATAAAAIRPTLTAQAADGDVVHQGAAHYGDTTTSFITTDGPALEAIVDSGPAVTATSLAGRGVVGGTDSGVGVDGQAGGDGVGVRGLSNGGDAVVGIALAGSGSGVTGEAQGGTGVRGTSAQGDGVDGRGSIGVRGEGVSGTAQGWGVAGYGSVGVYAQGSYTGLRGDAVEGIGVDGWSSSGTGVRASATTGTALSVVGKAKFSRARKVKVKAGKSKLNVTLAGVTTSSLVFAVLHSNRSGVYVRAVIPASGSFTIYLNRTVTTSTYVAYFVVN